MQYFGVKAGLPHSSSASIDAAAAAANPLALATLAKGLTARVVTAGQAAPNLDMAALWPAAYPQWLISCNEQGASDPALQRINLATEAATTIAGLVSCDPAHTTAWGTLIFGEEAGSTGGMYEMLDPTAVTGVVIDRVTGAVSGGTGADKVVRRDALGFLSFEGIGVLPSGVAYYGDELSPASGSAAGSYYKFIPSVPWTGSPVTSLAASPLASGHVFGLQVGQGSNTGPGMSYGDGVWVPMAAGQLRRQAAAAELTEYYRPEDLNLDEGLLAASGDVRFCGNNTGREEAHYYGETICVRDGTVSTALAGTSVPSVSLLVAGSPAINMPDNIAYQPHRGNWIIHEDAATDFQGPHNNDLWNCLDDGGDANLQSDGCLRIETLNDLTAEWTGGFFDATGKHFYVSIQHNITGKGVVLDITGWR